MIKTQFNGCQTILHLRNTYVWYKLCTFKIMRLLRVAKETSRHIGRHKKKLQDVMQVDSSTNNSHNTIIDKSTSNYVKEVFCSLFNQTNHGAIKFLKHIFNKIFQQLDLQLFLPYHVSQSKTITIMRDVMHGIGTYQSQVRNIVSVEVVSTKAILQRFEKMFTKEIKIDFMKDRGNIWALFNILKKNASNDYT